MYVKYYITRMQKEHWPEVRDIYEMGIMSEHATFETEAPSWELWSATHDLACRLVAIDSTTEKVIGWAALAPVSGREVYEGVGETSVYIHQDERGRGVGGMLLEALIEKAETEGYWTLQAGIFPENDYSLRIHRRKGFREVGVRERIGKMQGRWRDVVLLERRSQVVGVEEEDNYDD